MSARLTPLLLIVLASVLVGFRTGHAHEPVDREKAARVKAAYLYHLARLATWPEGTFASEDDSLRIGIVGDDPFDLAGLFFTSRQDLRAGRHPLSIDRLALPVGDEQAAGLARYHLVYFTEAARGLAWRTLHGGTPPGVLVTAEIDGFCENGGMVGFEIGDGRVSIEVNQDALRRGAMRLSAEFMQHATLVAPVLDRRD